MPDTFRDDEALSDAQIIICIVDHVDTLLFVKPIRQRTTTKQLLIHGDELNVNVAKFNVPFINSGIVSYSLSGKVSFAPNSFIIQVQMPEFALLDIFLSLA